MAAALAAAFVVPGTAHARPDKQHPPCSKACVQRVRAHSQAKNAVQHRNCGTPACNRRLGAWMARHRGWVGRQFACLDTLWGGRESHWNRLAHNPYSGAHGIPQALPGSKMGPGWWDNATVQIRWGLSYIAGRYRTPCGALAHSYATGWY